MFSCNYNFESMTSAFRGLKTDGSWSSFTGPTSPVSGCGVTSTTIAPVLIDNSTTAYTVEVVFSAADPQLSFSGYRVGYKLQVSPPPGTATFADVPTTHLFYQYVEALAAAGITSGCGGGNFCPDAAVTRGQMAVFLSKALGLHWAP
jgi:hypothetical protein